MRRDRNRNKTNPKTVAWIIGFVILFNVIGSLVSAFDENGFRFGAQHMWWIIGTIVVIFGLGGLRVIDQFERGVVLTLGKYTGTRTPGLTWILLIVQRMDKVDLRVTTVDIPSQEVITKDNVTVGINAVVYFNVSHADKAILEIKDFRQSVALYAQATLRDVIGEVELDNLLSERESIAEQIKKIVDMATDPWGIKVSYIKMQDIELPADMKRVMAKQAESERERRAVIIRAEGEFTAAEKLAQAAERLSAVPGGLSLRTLATIEKIGPEPSKTTIFVLPIEFYESVKSLGEYLKAKK